MLRLQVCSILLHVYMCLCVCVLDTHIACVSVCWIVVSHTEEIRWGRLKVWNLMLKYNGIFGLIM